MGVSHKYRAIRRKMGYRTDVPVWNQVPRGGIAPFGGSVNLPQKVLRDMGYRSDSIAIPRDMGPLSWKAQEIWCPELRPAECILFSDVAFHCPTKTGHPISRNIIHPEIFTT